MTGRYEIFKRGIFLAATCLCAVGVMGPNIGYAGLLGTNAYGTLRFDPLHNNFFDPSPVPGNAAVVRPVTPAVEFVGNTLAMLTMAGHTLTVTADIGNNDITLTAHNYGLLPDTISGNTVYRFGLFPQVGAVHQKISGVVFDAGNAPPSGSLTFGPHFVQMTYLPGTLPPGFTATAHFTLAFVTAPEPSTYLLLGTMALIAGLAAQRRKANEMITSQQVA